MVRWEAGHRASRKRLTCCHARGNQSTTRPIVRSSPSSPSSSSSLSSVAGVLIAADSTSPQQVALDRAAISRRRRWRCRNPATGSACVPQRIQRKLWWSWSRFDVAADVLAVVWLIVPIMYGLQHMFKKSLLILSTQSITVFNNTMRSALRNADVRSSMLIKSTTITTITVTSMWIDFKCVRKPTKSWLSLTHLMNESALIC